MELESLLFYDLVLLTACYHDWRRGQSTSSPYERIKTLSLSIPLPLTHQNIQACLYVLRGKQMLPEADTLDFDFIYVCQFPFLTKNEHPLSVRVSAACTER